jgi:hypothetical protein
MLNIIIKRNLLRKTTCLLLFICLSHCTERIEIEVDSSYTRLVVEGYINTDTIQHSVRLTKSSDYFYNQPAPYLSDAIVTISDGDSTIFLSESQDHPGTYLTHPGYYGVPGKTYTLEISHVDIDNDGVFEEYTASSELRQTNKVDSIQLEPLTGDNFNIFQILVFALDPPAKDFYAFKVLKNRILVTDTLSELIIQDDIFFNGNYIYGAPSQFLDQNEQDEVVHSGDTITFEINGITEEYYKFIMEAQSETFYQTPLFSGPPANISSNISNGAIGFFTAYSINRCSIVYYGNKKARL